MAINKVVYGQNTIIDITDTTATASDVAQGKYFYTSAGVKTQGTATIGGGEMTWDDVASKNIGDGILTLTVSSIKAYAFRAYNFTTLIAPNLTSIAREGLSYNKFSALFFNKLISIGQDAFIDTTTLITIVCKGGVSSFGYGALRNLSNLVAFDVGAGTTASISTNAIISCTKLATIVIRKSSVMALANVNSLNATAFASSRAGGTLYVPSALISNYKSASNWSTILGYANNMILPVEGSYYQTHYVDGTEISGASYSDEKYWLPLWWVVRNSNDDTIAYASTLKSVSRSVFIALRGEHPIRLGSVTGKNTFVYPIEVPSGSTGVTVTSSSLDFNVRGLQWDGTEWQMIELSAWLLQSESDSHSYTFSNQNITHIFINARVAGDESGTGTITQAMLDAITFGWDS